MSIDFPGEATLIKFDGGLTTYLVEKNQLQDIKKIWKGLENKLTDPSLTSTWSWVESWINTYDGLLSFWFILGVKNNQIVGAALVVKEVGRAWPLPVKSYHIGTSGEPYKDWVQMIDNGLLVKEQDRISFLQAIVETIKHKFSWEEIVFDLYRKSDAKWIEKTLLRGNHRFGCHIQPEVCLTVNLASTNWSKQDLSSLFSLGTNRKLKQSLRAFGGDLQVESAKKLKQATEIFNQLIKLHQAHWEKRGKRGMFASPYFTKFHKTIIKKLFLDGKIMLFRVRSKKYGPIGCLYLFINNQTAYAYLSGTNDFVSASFPNINQKRVKPAILTHALCMEECAKVGIKEYNFCTGLHRYKFELANAQKEVVTISLRKNFKGQLRGSLLKFYQKLDTNKSMQFILQPFYYLYRSFS